MASWVEGREDKRPRREISGRFSPKVISRIEPRRVSLWHMIGHARVVRTCAFSLAIISFLGVGALQAQVLQHKAPTELLVKQYEKLVADGFLLTPEGWARASKLFERSEAYPADGEIQLISAPGIIGETERNADRAEVYTKWGDYYGTIDSHLRYKPAVPNGGIITEDSFSVVLRHRRSGGAKDSEDWLIEGPLQTRSADIPQALRYVERRRDQSNDTIIRRNAERTIAALKRQIASGCGRQAPVRNVP
jgi:hypothetical protein